MHNRYGALHHFRSLSQQYSMTPRRQESTMTVDIPRRAVASAAYRLSGPAVKALSFVLDNGLTVALQENHVAPVVALNMWVKIGSVFERDEEAGISHVYEHMLFKGTQRRGVGAIAQEIEDSGGDINAFTSFDHTVYHITIASRFLDAGLDVMADAIQHSSFDPEELRKEQEVVLEEIKRGEDIPSRKLSEAMFATSYQYHPYRRPVIGSQLTVKSLTREHILEFFHTWYVPNNMVLVVTGDIDPQTTLSLIEQAFGEFRPGLLPCLHIAQEPVQRELRTVILSDDIQETLLDVAYHVPSVLHKDSYAIDLLSVILGGGESSRLYQAVKAEQDLVHAIDAYPFLPRDPGLFMINATLEVESWRDALCGILGEVERVQRDGVTGAELDKAKHNLESEFIYRRETVQGQAGQLGYFQAVLSDPLFESRYLRGVARATPRDLQRVARSYLTAKNLTVGAYLPTQNGPAITHGDIAQAVQSYHKRSRRRKSSRHVTSKQTHKYVLQNGMTLLVRENHAVPAVAMQAVFLGGVWVEDPAHSGIMNFLAEMLTKGTSHREAWRLAEEIESMAGDLSGFAGRNSFGVSAEMLQRHAYQGLELVADTLLHPTFEVDELEKKRADLLAALRYEEDDLFKVAFNLFMQCRFPDHPYGLRVLGIPESISQMTREDLIAWHRRYTVPNNLVLAVVGDIEFETVKASVEELFGAWPSAPLMLPTLGRPVGTTARGPVICLREKEQTHIIVGVRGTSILHPDRYALRVLESILSSQGGRLFVELREKRSLAYTVTARSLEGLDPFVFFVYLATSSEKVEAALEGIETELHRVREEGVTAQEVERAKRYLVGSYEIELQKNSAQAAMLAFDERYGIGYQELERYAQHILSVTPQMVQHVAHTYLADESPTAVIVGPPLTKIY